MQQGRRLEFLEHNKYPPWFKLKLTLPINNLIKTISSIPLDHVSQETSFHSLKTHLLRWSLFLANLSSLSLLLQEKPFIKVFITFRFPQFFRRQNETAESWNCLKTKNKIADQFSRKEKPLDRWCAFINNVLCNKNLLF